MKRKGSVGCAGCGGTGVVQTPSGYRVCKCVRGTPAGRRAMQRANAAMSTNPRGDSVRKAVEEADRRLGR